MIKNEKIIFTESELNYLKLLSKTFGTIADASIEIINLEAIINLPKGTEYFLTDLHGEDEAFRHVLKNASGVIRQKVKDFFGNAVMESEITELCTLIYYPEQKVELVKLNEKNLNDWYRIRLNQLIAMLRSISSKYTRSKVSKSLPHDFSYIIQELLHESDQMPNKHDYFNGILASIISVGRADEFIISMCNLIQRLTIDTLHIVGDVFDRGAGPHHIMDILDSYHNFDIQWGNHDILWMGAAAGNLASIANVIRISLRHSNVEVLEDGYGINLLPLATFAMEVYGDDPCVNFTPKNTSNAPYKDKTIKLMSQMYKAITIIQLKLEGELIKRNPEWEMESRNLFDMINFKDHSVVVDGHTYKMTDMNFPTITESDPYKLSDEEFDLVEKLRMSFANSEKLSRHIRCLYAHGSMYLAMNGNLMYHAMIPMNSDGTFREVSIDNKKYKGKALMDKLDKVARRAYSDSEISKKHKFANDYMWYLWCGKDSPLFGKSKMATFERCFISDKAAQREIKDSYYDIIEQEEVCNTIFKEFSLPIETSHIINGHLPVKLPKGEKPIKANGKLLVIDGGFSKAYQPATGIAGYTLIYNSYGLQLVQHEPFESTQQAIERGKDIKSTRFVVESNINRIKVRDTNIGKELQIQIDNLHKLLVAFRMGQLKERK